MSMTNDMEAGILGYVFRDTSSLGMILSTNLQIGLYTAAPGEGGGGTEVSGNGYARVNISRQGTGFTGTNPVTNAVAITFPESTGAWGNVTHAGIFATGFLIFYAALATPRNVDSAGIVLTIPVGALSVSMD